MSSEERAGSTRLTRQAGALPPPTPGKTLLLGALVVAVCCGAPLFLGALVVTGAGASLAAAGWPAVGIALAAIGLVGLLWWIRGIRRACEPASDTAAVAKDVR